MIPWAKLNTAAVTSIQPPQRTNAARVRSRRGARKVRTRTAPRTTSAAGRSQAVWVPNIELNMRVQPVGPQADDPARPPPTLPLSLPVSRPKPL